MVGRSSLEAELVRVGDDSVGIHCEGVEHHGRVDEVLLDTLQAGIQLLKPHHLGCACNRKQACWQPLALPTPSHCRTRTKALLEGTWRYGKPWDVLLWLPETL